MSLGIVTVLVFVLDMANLKKIIENVAYSKLLKLALTFDILVPRILLLTSGKAKYPLTVQC